MFVSGFEPLRSEAIHSGQRISFERKFCILLVNFEISSFCPSDLIVQFSKK